MSEQCDGCERCKELEEQVEFLQEALFDLEDIVLGEYGSSAALAEMDKRGGVLDRLDSLEAGELDAGDIMSAANDAGLPIQQLTAARKGGHMTDQSDKNKYRATLVWSAFYDRATRDSGKLKLSSKDVKGILREHDLPTNRNTVRRVMEFVAEYSNPDPSVRDPQAQDNLVILVKATQKNMLVADREEFEQLAEDQTRKVEQEADEALERLATAEVATDD